MSQAAGPAAGQRRGRRIAMDPDEIDEFLGESRTCRVATVSSNGPHVSPLWFVWHDGAVWLYSIVTSQRFKDLRADPRVAIVVDDGHDFEELRGVELSGEVTVIGEVPRTGDPLPEAAGAESAYARKYQGRDELVHDGRHAWVCLQPRKVVSWDFRKMPARET